MIERGHAFCIFVIRVGSIFEKHFGGDGTIIALFGTPNERGGAKHGRVFTDDSGKSLRLEPIQTTTES